MIRQAIASLLVCGLLFGQQPASQQQPAPAADGTVTFRTNTQLVVETVIVKDKNGKPIEGLTAKDFVITEDGVPQTIQFCEFQKLDAAPDTSVTPPAAPAGAITVPPVTRSQITPETPGDIRYRDKRMLAIYFDMTSMPIPDQIRALGAATKFIRTQMKPADVMAIMSYTGASVKILNDFTSDRDELEKSIQTLVVGDGQGFDENAADESTADTGTAFGQDDAEFNIFNTDRQLAALQTAVKMLGTLNEKKSLIYFASGLRLNGTNNQAQLQATTNAAVRANVSFYPIDARGLVASAPLGDATVGSPGGIGMYTGGIRAGRVFEFPALAGHALRAGGRYRRQGAARLQRSGAGHCAGAAGDDQLLHHRLLHDQAGSRRQVPKSKSHACTGIRRRSSITGMGYYAGQDVQ